MDHSRTLSTVLTHIHTGAARTRPELVRQTDLGRSVVNERLAEAIAADLVEESDEAVSTGGRPSKTLRLRQDRGAVLATVFGASEILVEVRDLGGTVLAHASAPWEVETGARENLRVVSDIGRELLVGLPQSLWAIAVGAHGPVDIQTGRAMFPATMPGWYEYPVRDELEKCFSVPVFVENDANLMTLGTWRSTDQADDNVLFVKADSGIGAGIIANGVLIRGAGGAAGDFGHTTIADHSGILCKCGNYGCLESLAAGWALARDARVAAFRHESEYLRGIIAERDAVTPLEIAQGSIQGDRVCAQLLERSGTLLGASVSTAISLLNPSTVYIGGALAEAGELYLEAVSAEMKRRVQLPAHERVTLKAVDLDQRVGMLGAHTLALQSLLSAPLLSKWSAAGDPRGVSASLQWNELARLVPPR